jgi:hypothetical protein
MKVKRFDIDGTRRESPDGYYVWAQDYADVLELLRMAEVAIRTQSTPPDWWEQQTRARLTESDERCPVGDHCPCRTDVSELHRVIVDGWYQARRFLTADDSPYQWMKSIHEEWIAICDGQRAQKTEQSPQRA